MWQRCANLVKASLAKRFVRRCFSSKVADKSEIKLPPICEEQSLHDAPTDVYLVCDTNLVIDYTLACNDGPRSQRISGWREYADKVAAHGGQRLFMLETQRHKLHGPLPEIFHILPTVHGIDHLERAYREFTRRLSEDPNYQSLLSQFKIEAMMIMEFNICLANNDGIPLEAFFSRRALLATANCAAIRQMLGLPDKRRMMEKLIDDMGLEHLGHIRYIEQQSGKGHSF